MKFVLIKKRSILKMLVVAVVLAGAIVSVALSGTAKVWSGATVRKLPIYSVETNEKKVAISFDACWGNEKTMGILETLEKFDVPATFFAVGTWAQKYPDDLKKLSESGRMEIGTHSNTHPHMNKLSAKQASLELSTSMNTIEEITGKRPELFRAPYGEYGNTLLDEAEKNGLYTIQWDVDSLDWKDLSASEITKRIMGKANSGSIILMHNDGKHTLEALPAIITGLKNKGFTLVPIGELIYKDNFDIDHTGRQIRRK